MVYQLKQNNKLPKKFSKIKFLFVFYVDSTYMIPYNIIYVYHMEQHFTHMRNEYLTYHCAYCKNFTRGGGLYWV